MSSVHHPWKDGINTFFNFFLSKRVFGGFPWKPIFASEKKEEILSLDYKKTNPVLSCNYELKRPNYEILNVFMASSSRVPLHLS